MSKFNPLEAVGRGKFEIDQIGAQTVYLSQYSADLCFLQRHAGLFMISYDISFDISSVVYRKHIIPWS